MTIPRSSESLDTLLKSLQEREKELNCLYNVEEILNSTEELGEALHAIIDAIPPGWQYPASCQAEIECDGQQYCSPNFQATSWGQCAPINVGELIRGKVCVYYTEEMPEEADGPFLQEEQKLLNNIADRIGHHLFRQQSKQIIEEWNIAKERFSQETKPEWQVIIDLLQRTDHDLYLYVSRKMIYHLCWSGIQEAQELWENLGTTQKLQHSGSAEESNAPSPKISLRILHSSSEIFKIAARYLSHEEIFSNIQRWIRESKTNFLFRSLDSRDSSMGEMVDAIRHFHHMSLDSHELPAATRQIVNVGILLGFFTDQPDFIRVAKEYITIDDMYQLLTRTIYSVRGRGKIGGKSAGLFLASQILKQVSDDYAELQGIKVPKTWYVTSNEIFKFVLFNNLEEVVEQKYKPLELVRLEYPHIVQIFKNSPFPPEITAGLSRALDDFGDRPLIVRSSSLLEDRLGTAFSGKYKSLFLANQGTKEKRLEALTDAIAEVYASTFGPDPIEYRIQHGLLEFHEEMGVMIQEVVGTKVGKYFSPSYAGVAFSNNEFRWSPRIQRKDGLIRLVPGLGTRAVDRISDDYSILIAPGQPNLQVNVSLEEKIRYAPKKVDVLNLETNTFETIEFETLVKMYGDQIPALDTMVSVINHDHLSRPGIMTDFSQEDCVVTFEGLRTSTRFVQHIHTILKVLEEKMHAPVDIEFASDGKDLYLLQCRSQSYFLHSETPPIPKDIPEEKIIFSTNKFVSNGKVSNITHLVYVDPHAYHELTERSELLKVGRIISKLNKLLPKRQFILMGPGRWGNRGDIKLGVNVTYSDINNTAVLIEMASKQGNYVPELSFGTHFFQDLVESSIFYLPLYLDSDGTIFNKRFLSTRPNMLLQILPEYASLSNTVKIIDIPGTAGGEILELLMNAELDETLAYLKRPDSKQDKDVKSEIPDEEFITRSSEDFWKWRLRMANQIASQIDPNRFGIKGFYIIGSTKNATAGPGSDIDLLLHARSTEQQRRELEAWLEGWSLCLDEINYLKTGYRADGLLDVHIVTDEDIAHKSSFAVKIGAVTDAARKLPMMKTE